MKERGYLKVVLRAKNTTSVVGRPTDELRVLWARKDQVGEYRRKKMVNGKFATKGNRRSRGANNK